MSKPRYPIPWTRERIISLIKSKGFIDYNNYHMKDNTLRRMCESMKKDRLVEIRRVDRGYMRVTIKVFDL